MRHSTDCGPESDGASEEGATTLGPIRATFRPARSNLVAGALIGLLLCVGGTLLAGFTLRTAWQRHDQIPWFQQRGESLGVVLLWAATGVGAVVGGGFLLRWVWRTASLRVLVCAQGLALVYQGTLEECRWDQVEHIREEVTRERIPLNTMLRHLDPGVKRRSYAVRRRTDGKTFVFTANTVSAVARLGQELRHEAAARLIPWEMVEVSR